mgnify:CR=1 FL=1
MWQIFTEVWSLTKSIENHGWLTTLSFVGLLSAGYYSVTRIKKVRDVLGVVVERIKPGKTKQLMELILQSVLVSVDADKALIYYLDHKNEHYPLGYDEALLLSEKFSLTRKIEKETYKKLYLANLQSLAHTCKNCGYLEMQYEEVAEFPYIHQVMSEQGVKTMIVVLIETAQQKPVGLLFLEYCFVHYRDIPDNVIKELKSTASRLGTCLELIIEWND